MPTLNILPHALWPLLLEVEMMTHRVFLIVATGSCCSFHRPQHTPRLDRTGTAFLQVSFLNEIVQMPLLTPRNRKGGRVLTVQRDASSKKSQDKLNVRILCIPPYVPRLGSTVSGVKKTKYDISLLYELIL